MARSKITKRWLFNSFGVILLILIAIEIFSAFGLKSYYYNGVRQTLISHADSVDRLLKDYAQDASTDFSAQVQRLVEGFEDKDKIEMMALNIDGEVLLSSSGFESTEKLYMPDFTDALSGAAGEGFFQGSLYGENIFAMTRLCPVGSDEIFAVRYITSLVRVDRQIISFVVIITALGVVTILFVSLTSTYFINSIVVSLGKIGQTARKIAQGDFNIRLEKENDDEIGEVCDVINYMAEELSKSEHLKNDFISSVSHELRTPLTAIKGWAETLSNQDPPDPQMTKRGMEVIGKETERLSGMVEELLDFSKIQSGRLSLAVDRMDLVAELDDVVLMFDQRIKRDNLTIDYEEPDGVIVIMGDQNRIKQVFVNILDNAIKHTPSGGCIKISVKQASGFVSVVISDNGEGIKPEDLPNVKEKFYKGASTKRGSGIGLAVADEIVSLHGGTLDIQSVYKEGTTVTVSLPLEKNKSVSAIA